MIIEKDVGLATEHSEANLFLQNGHRYRSTLKLCHSEVCFAPISTNGFVILAQPPEVGSVAIVSFTGGPDQTDVEFTLQPFTHNYVADGALTPDDLMDYYDWLIMDQAGLDGGIYAWKKIAESDITVDGDQVNRALF